MNKPIIGVRETVNAKVKAISVSRSWHCKISHLAHDVLIDGVKEYMADLVSIPSQWKRCEKGPTSCHAYQSAFYSKRLYHE